MLVSGHGDRKLAKARVATFVQRCALVSHLPSVQRGLCTADAVASLWLSAGSLYTIAEYRKLISASASALRPHTQKYSRVQLRSRAVEHLAGPRFHRTYPPAAAMYDSLRQLARLFRLRLLDQPTWTQLWSVRSRTAGTFLATSRRCHKFLRFTWCDSMTVKSGSFIYPLHIGPRRDPGEHAHILRETLRVATWADEAGRRPKDFYGAQRGIDMKLARETYCKPYGPSLVTAGSWTAMRLYIANLIDTPLCVRCFACADTKEHRLWWCDDNAPARSKLSLDLPDLDPHTLPSCLRRCALVPIDCNQPYAHAVVDYLLYASECATRALAHAYKETVTCDSNVLLACDGDLDAQPEPRGTPSSADLCPGLLGPLVGQPGTSWDSSFG